MTTPFGDFGAPPDAVSWTALVIGVALAAGTMARKAGSLRVIGRAEGRLFLVLVFALAAIAFALSVGYVAYYLRGGPRIIDATSYFLEARALAHGHVQFPIPSPSGSFRGRFLLAGEGARTLSVIFPPGYPALLALGFLVRAPMLVGPAIAAGLVVVTAALALRLFSDRRVALLAAALSTVCAVLRYHTADTMSHGWSALLLALALLLSLDTRSWLACLAGGSAGLLIATRPLTGVVALLLVALAARRSPRRLAGALLVSLPPVVLFVLEQRAITGTWFGSTQLSYYALADSPSHCFRYGFGAGIGCRFEHGDFVRAHLANGYGVLAALGTTLRRLKMHLADAGNVELFAPVLVFALGAAVRTGKGRLAAFGVLGVVLGYVPFYFDGNYPGGGARLFSDALPLEHALLAWGLVRLGVAPIALPLAFAGFALHTSYDHLKLASREGGRPMFEPRVLAEAGIRRGLVFVDTDHGFALGHDPSGADAESGVVVARRRHDAHDSILWERLGRPKAYAYDFALNDPQSSPHVAPLSLAMTEAPRFEAEAEWPPLALRGGSVLPVFPPCASGHRALAIEPSILPMATMRVEVVAPVAGRYRLVTGWVLSPHGVDANVRVGRVTGRVAIEAAPGTCVSLVGPVVELGKYVEFIDISVNSLQMLDYLELRADR